jgi:hypothetical protein
MTTPGIGHNGGPSIGGLSTLPVEGRAVGGIVKGAKAGLKGLTKLFESVGSGLKKSGLKKDERKEAAKAIQNEIDKVSEANNRKFRPKILRMEGRPDQDNNYSDVVIAAVDDENGKIAAVLNGKFFTKVDNRETFQTASGKERKNKNFGKEINYLNVGGFFPIQHEGNAPLKEILESLNVPIYKEGEGVISPEDLAKLNQSRDTALRNINTIYDKKIKDIDNKVKSGKYSREEAWELEKAAHEQAQESRRKVGQGHRADKIEMGKAGTLGFSKSLRAGLPITDAGAARISGSKSEGGELSIRGAPIIDTAAPMRSLPDIDLSADLLEEMGDTGLRSLTPTQLQTITKRIVPSVGLPSNVKKLEAVDARMERVMDEASARRDPYAARLLKEQDDLTRTQEVSKREPTIGELYSDETMIEKLQYALLNKLSGDLSGKKGLLSLVKRGDDEMIVGSRSPDDPGEVMKSAEGERLVPRRDFINPRIQKERVGEVTDPELMVPPDTTSQTSVVPDSFFREMSERRQQVESDLTTSDQILDAHREGIINETEAWDRLNGLIDSGRISEEEGFNDANRLRGVIASHNRQDGQVGHYNEDGSINVQLPDGTMATTRADPNDLGNLLNQVEDGFISPEEALAIVDAFEVNIIYPEEADQFRSMLDTLMNTLNTPF